MCAAVVLPFIARQGVAGTLLAAMRGLPAAEDPAHVLVPVRPALRAAHPLTPIEIDAAWRRADGLPLDPWPRTHTRIGVEVLSCAPASQTLTATVAKRETWSGLALPSTGRYVIPGGLVPLQVDRENDRATMVEPNIWVQHR